MFFPFFCTYVIDLVTGQRGREISALASTSDESTLREWTGQELLP